MAFGLNFFDLAPGLRVAGDSLAYAYKFTKKGGQADGVEGLEVGLTDDPTIKLLEAAVSGFEQVADRDAIYTALVSGGLTELVPGLAVGIDSLSSIDTSSSNVRLSLAGSQPVLVFRNASVPAVTKVGDGGYTWDLPGTLFATLKTAAESYESDLKTKVEEMIAARITADGVLQAAVDAQATSDATARGVIETNLASEIADRIAAITAEEQRVDALIASGMWLFADQAAFPAAADNHGRVVHSHADGAIFYAHGGMWHQVAKEVDLQTAVASIANEALAREAADTTLQAGIDAEAATRAADDTAEATARAGADSALSGRLDVLEADPTTATAVAGGDAATLSSANTYTDTSITNLVNGADTALDTLKEIGDALAQGDSDVTAALTAQITTESTTRANADTALSGRLDVLEADPVTATYVDSADGALSTRLDSLEADPTTATAVAAVQSDVDQNEADADAAIAGLDGRLGVLEADPTTATAVAAVQTNLDTEAGTRASADSALDGRLDVLEADPTTATALTDGLALKAPLADPDFTGQLDVDTNARIEFADNLTKIHNVLRGTSINIGNNIEMKPAAAGGRVEITGDLILDYSDMVDAANDADAATAGVPIGGVYRHGNDLKIRIA